MITTQDMSRKKFKFWLNNMHANFKFSSVAPLGGWGGGQLMLYRGCLRCNRVINLVALFPINYPQCYKKKLITHQRGPTPESLLTTLTNRELPQFAQRLIYLFPTQSEAGRKIPANWILLSFVLPSHLCHWKTLCNNSEECLQLKLSLPRLQIREGLLLLSCRSWPSHSDVVSCRVTL